METITSSPGCQSAGVAMGFSSVVLKGADDAHDLVEVAADGLGVGT
ncbi:MAG: hypothetical protein R2715_14285 [Ilumatobacteraceae bacterium]